MPEHGATEGGTGRAHRESERDSRTIPDVHILPKNAGHSPESSGGSGTPVAKRRKRRHTKEAMWRGVLQQTHQHEEEKLEVLRKRRTSDAAAQESVDARQVALHRVLAAKEARRRGSPDSADAKVSVRRPTASPEELARLQAAGVVSRAVNQMEHATGADQALLPVSISGPGSSRPGRRHSRIGGVAPPPGMGVERAGSS